MKKTPLKRTPNKKRQLANKADKLWREIVLALHPYCEVCGKPSNTGHHYYYRGSYAHLRYNIDNGIGLCVGCHFCLHHQDPKMIEDKIREKRGKKWVDKMRKLSEKRLKSFQTIAYYEAILNQLSK